MSDFLDMEDYIIALIGDERRAQPLFDLREERLSV